MSRHRTVRPRRPRRRGRRLLVAAVALTVLPVGIGVAGLDVSRTPDVLTDRVALTDRGTLTGRIAQIVEGSRARVAPAAAVADPVVLQDATLLPADSGEGRRVVFSESRQRVWLVGRDERVRRTYPVSGSVHDNLFPGTYEVYSRSERAVGIDDSGTMRWFVRFTTGTRGAAIGFHSIPVLDGRPVQTRAQLGTPLSHGCIRQARADAVALWEFAPIGTTVVVTP